MDGFIGFLVILCFGSFVMIKLLKKKKSSRKNMGIEFSVSDVQVNFKEVIPCEKRIKTAFASEEGLFPHEILALDYAPSFFIGGEEAQNFWWYSYGVKDIYAVLHSLYERGFLEIGGIESTVKQQTMAELKEVLRSYQLKLSGKKAELVERVLTQVPKDDIEALFSKRMYVLTAKGSSALKEGEYISYIHRNSVEDLDIWSLNKLIHKEPLMPYRDKIWSHLNERSMMHIRNNDFGLYGNCRYTMANFLEKEGKIKDALMMLAEVVFFDLTGLPNNYKPEHLYIIAPNFFPYKSSFAKTASGIINKVTEYQEKLKISDKELKSLLLERIEALYSPLQLFTARECVQIIFWGRDQDIENLEKVYNKAKQRFKKKYPKIDLDKILFD